MNRSRVFGAGLFALLAAAVAAPPLPADGPKDNLPDNVRPIPPKGVPVPAADLAELKAGLAELGTALDGLKDNPLLPDVEIYHKAVRYAVEYGEFFDPKGGDVKAAKRLLTEGRKRAAELKAGTPNWPTATGYVVRGYRSKIDGSAQPYGLLVPKEFDPKGIAKHRLDFWWHGRGETLSEVQFMGNEQKAAGITLAPGAFVLFPYGRYCNANKLAGEVDTFECLDHAKKHYRIDENRLVARGFSMGGAACWQYAVHYPTLWAAAAPGAGFAETPEFLNNFQNEQVKPTWYEQRLWRMYNATDYAQNLFNLPTVAYSGEIDKQKQAADVMAREMKKVGLELKHVIGPKTAHSYEKAAKVEVNQLIDAIVEKGKPAEPRAEFKFVTHTLQYNQCAWVTVDGLAKHWEPATVTGTFKDGVATLTTNGVTALSIRLPFEVENESKKPKVVIDGTELPVKWLSATKFGGTAEFRKIDGRWQAAPIDAWLALQKRHGLQGPIDDAFLSEFHVYGPTGPAAHPGIDAWVKAELFRFGKEWRKQFRGDVPTTLANAAVPEDVAAGNLILWGDPASNKVLAEVVKKLPIKWTAESIEFGGQTYDAKTHVPALIFPNPLNPEKYVVLNSSFTFREYDYLNNARQVPKLPDYAIIDTTTPPNSRYPGKVVRAGFFGEKWELLPDDGK